MDYTQRPTSELIALLAAPGVLTRELHANHVYTPGAHPLSEEYADNVERTIAHRTAIAAELDRRIPIPEKG